MNQVTSSLSPVGTKWQGLSAAARTNRDGRASSITLARWDSRILGLLKYSVGGIFGAIDTEQ